MIRWPFFFCFKPPRLLRDKREARKRDSRTRANEGGVDKGCACSGDASKVPDENENAPRESARPRCAVQDVRDSTDG